jgi:hypothetical protein
MCAAAAATTHPPLNMPGYSGTPLPQKLGIKAGFRVAFFAIPADVSEELKTALTAGEICARGPLDFAMIFVKSQAEMHSQFPRFAKRLSPAGMLWVSWPKKSSGIQTDLGENQVRRTGLDAGLVDVKVCAVTETWSGLKFVLRVQDRPKK